MKEIEEIEINLEFYFQVQRTNGEIITICKVENIDAQWGKRYITNSTGNLINHLLLKIIHKRLFDFLILCYFRL